MDLLISNCNNIVSAAISVVENRLNIKYAINGTGKSTIAKAIQFAATQNDDGLVSLTPYQYVGENHPEHQPTVTGLPGDITVALFDESYVDQYVFIDDELVKDSFEIFVKTENYDQRLAEINDLIVGVRNIFDENPDLDSLISDMSEFIAAFGRNDRTGIANNGALVKGMSGGNLIRNIPQGLEDYSAFLTGAQNSKWLKWQTTGREYLRLADRCPFCASDITPRRQLIERIKEEYDPKTIEHLSKILDLFERLGHYFSEQTNEQIREITSSVQGLSDEQKNYLVEIKRQVETFHGKLLRLKQIGFNSLKDMDRLAEAIPSFKIDMRYFSHLDTEYTVSKVNTINASIDRLIEEVGRLQGAVNRQKREIENTVQKYNREINDFLINAGYNYTVAIEETPDHSYKLLLKFGDDGASISGIKSHLSFGERNALALVLFMYQALYKHANLIILDDPISSFDKNKKFAILDMLFIRGESFRGKTTIMLTHDFEPVIDAIYNHPNFFEGTPSACFVENVDGFIHEQSIQKEDILSSIQVATQNISPEYHLVTRLIYLRRRIEIINGKNEAWHLLSNLLHKRAVPMIGSDEREMSQEEIQIATNFIKESIPEFDYSQILDCIQNEEEMRALFTAAHSNYEKLQIYRLLFDPINETHVLRKYLNETYHIENDYLFQLNPVSFNTVPLYIIEECNRAVFPDGIEA